MPGITETIKMIRLVSPATALRTLIYAAKHARIDQMAQESSHSKRVDSTIPRPPGRLKSADLSEDGGKFIFEFTTLAVRFLTPDFVFIAWDGAEMTPSYAIEQTDWKTGNITNSCDEQGWRLASSELELVVGMDGGLRFSDFDGRVIRQENAPWRTGSGWRHVALLSTEAGVYGLGERATGGLNLRPGSYRCWNQGANGAYGPGKDPLYIGMPVYMVIQRTGALLAFYDNTYDSQILIGDTVEVKANGGPLRYYVAIGKPERVMERLTKLTGRAPLPPEWALGYHHSRWGFQTEKEMRRVYEGFCSRDLPLSVLYMDIDHMVGYRTLTVDKQRYPHLKEFAAEMAKTGTHLGAITDPGVKQDPDFEIYQQGLALNAFCKDSTGQVISGPVWPGWSVFPDFTDPKVREWWGGLYKRSLDEGITAVWHDMNEPSVFSPGGELTLPLSIKHCLDGRGGDHRQAHNLYGLLMNRSGFEGLRRLAPEKRPFLLSRSGWVGMARYSWSWTGDIESTWAELKQTIATVLGLGLSGMPYSGPDIGGFSSNPSPELYTRWFQLASYLPFFRTHSAFFLPPREPWEFTPQIQAILKEALKNRYRLLPYWYTLAFISSQTGTPLIRPLFWDDPENQDYWNFSDTFMVGEALLVAPVVEQGATRRKVNFPAGDWFLYNDDESPIVHGSDVLETDAPLESIPVFVKAGSIIPLQEGKITVIHLYKPGKNGAGHGFVYHDAGDGYGPHRLETYQLDWTEDDIYRLSRKVQGEYDGQSQSIWLELHGFNTREIWDPDHRIPYENGPIEISPFETLFIPANPD